MLFAVGMAASQNLSRRADSWSVERVVWVGRRRIGVAPAAEKRAENVRKDRLVETKKRRRPRVES